MSTIVRANPSHGLRLAIVGAALSCAACPGSLEDPGRFAIQDAAQLDGDDAGSCPDIQQTLFIPVCATAGCHTTADKIQGLDLQSPGVASRLVGVCATGGGLLIDPATPAHSVVYEKLTAAPPFGARMPFGKPGLDAPTIACVLSWVTAQAADGGSGRGCATDGGSD